MLRPLLRVRRPLTVLLSSAALLIASGTLASADCFGDLNGDGQIDAADDDVFKALFGAEAGDPDYLPEADLDQDGMIGGSDFLALQQAKADGC